MEQAAADERTRRAMAIQAQADARKRPPSISVQGEEEVKRQKVEGYPNADATALLAAFDFTTLPVGLIAELIVANLQAFSEENFQARINAYRRSASTSVAAPAPVPAATVPMPTTVLETTAASENVAPVKLPPTMPAADRARERFAQVPSTQVDEPTPSSRVKEEPVDPLQMDMDEEIEYEPDRLNLEVYIPSYPRPMSISSTCPPQLEPMQDDDETLASVELHAGELVPLEFQVPAPAVLEEAERAATVKSAATRIWQSSGDLAVGPQTGGQDMWMLLLVRMITRVVDPEDGKGKAKAGGAVQKATGPDTDADVEMDDEMVELYERQDRLRRVLCDYIMADFSGR